MTSELLVKALFATSDVHLYQLCCFVVHGSGEDILFATSILEPVGLRWFWFMGSEQTGLHCFNFASPQLYNIGIYHRIVDLHIL